MRGGHVFLRSGNQTSTVSGNLQTQPHSNNSPLTQPYNNGDLLAFVERDGIATPIGTLPGTAAAVMCHIRWPASSYLCWRPNPPALSKQKRHRRPGNPSGSDPSGSMGKADGLIRWWMPRQPPSGARMPPSTPCTVAVMCARHGFALCKGRGLSCFPEPQLQIPICII